MNIGMLQGLYGTETADYETQKERILQLFVHYETTPIQIYRKFHLQKLKFSDKKL